MSSDSSPPPFVLSGPADPVHPVLLSVPHAGRYYPASLLAQARVPADTLVRLEDRYADRLVAEVVDAGFSAIIATHARAWIDLNRDTSEIDPEMIIRTASNRLATRMPQPGVRVRGGLGLFPRRLGKSGDFWRGGFELAELQARIASIHAPYHQAIAKRLDRLCEQHGHALLIDVHSMPSLAGPDGAQIVLGDRFGRTAPGWLVQPVEDEARASGYRTARNIPYAGGYGIETHNVPPRCRYALQIEIDRALYLDTKGEPSEAGRAQVGAMLARIATRAESTLVERRASWPEAAE